MGGTATAVAKGLATYVPGLYRLRLRDTGGTSSARYCYAVWIRHLVLARRNGLAGVPPTVAELGPGDSLGTGLAALLSGAERYLALDVVRRRDANRNLPVLDELIDLFDRRARVPDAAEFPLLEPSLPDYGFPAEILSDSQLERALDPDRVAGIRRDLATLDDGGGGRTVTYHVPWDAPDVIRAGSVDFAFSQAALEHVADLDGTYAALWRWLAPGGIISNEVDFRCHGTAAAWNGHWAYGDRLWRLVWGRRPYLLNRSPHSAHLELLAANGFEVVCDDPTRDTSGLPAERLAPRFRGLSEADTTTSTAFIQARKPAER